jgi:phosphoribosylglycinamide formyltransferase
LRKEEEITAEARQKYDAALAAKILSTDKQRPELIVLAGWMHVFSKAFLEPMERAGVRVINIHPALPGKFSGIMLGLATYSLHRGVRRSYGD